jgi:pimeloyl-ACP methyl ester carboxylesterase
MLAEKNPELFSGALCIGGPLGGARMEVNYIYNLRILFDRLFRDELGLAAVGAPSPLRETAAALAAALGTSALQAQPSSSPLLPADGVAFARNVVPLIQALFAMGPADAAALAAVAVDGVPLFNWPLPPDPAPTQSEVAAEMAIALAVGLWYNIYGTEDLLGRTHMHVPVDNRASVYAVLATGQILDVERLSSTSDAGNYLDHWYLPSGDLSVPVVILHTTRDPIVPVYHARAYAALVASKGKGALLQEIELPCFGHCEILQPPAYTPDAATFQAQLLAAFDKLVFMSGI